MGVPDANTLTQANLDKVYAGVKALKFGYVQIPVPWAIIQPSRGAYVWTPTDLAVNRALLAGLQPMLVLSPPMPNWVGGFSVGTPTANDFGTFAEAVANRYRISGSGITLRGQGVQEYQIWDEPNVAVNWPTPQASVKGVTRTSTSSPRRDYVDNSDGDEYAVYLKAAYTAIKKVQPGATVVFAALQATMAARVVRARRITASTIYETDPITFLSDAYTAGAKSYFDVMAYHPLSTITRQFPKPPPPSANVVEQSDDIRATMVARGDTTKPMYWTGVGYSTTLFSFVQQQSYLDTVRWLALKRNYVTGLGLHSYRDT